MPTYAVLGTGMQGTAAAYDLARFSGGRILLVDRSAESAHRASDRIKALAPEADIHAVLLDALDLEALSAFLGDVDVAVSCLPHWMPQQIAPVAVRTKTHLCDLGSDNTPGTGLFEWDAEAKSAGVAIVPDCGLAPGLVNSIAMAMLGDGTAQRVRVYCGVLPVSPQPPLFYRLAFAVDALIAEYEDPAIALLDGEVAIIPSMADLEEIDFPAVGRLEAFTTSGGAGTMPWSLQGRVGSFVYKTLRFPGHAALMGALRELGFWNQPHRDAVAAALGDHLAALPGPDFTAIRVQVDDRVLDLVDHADSETGFTSMERLTGYSISIVAQAMARGEVAPGAQRYEHALDANAFLAEVRRRGIAV